MGTSSSEILSKNTVQQAEVFRLGFLLMENSIELQIAFEFATNQRPRADNSRTTVTEGTIILA